MSPLPPPVGAAEAPGGYKTGTSRNQISLATHKVHIVAASRELKRRNKAFARLVGLGLGQGSDPGGLIAKMSCAADTP